MDSSEKLHAQRPPSPLHNYNYGAISVRPRSRKQQQRQKAGAPSRPHYRQEICGVYFPGPDCVQGPYGFSMQDPILIPPMVWVDNVGRAPPDRYPGEASDMRPRTAPMAPHSKATTAPSQTKPKREVRSNNAHQLRERHVADAVRKREEEAMLEHIRFEQGHFEGRWKAPVLSGDTTLSAQKDETQCGRKFAWQDHTAGDLPDLASWILLGLDFAMREHRAKLTHLFKYVNRGVPGVLEPVEFLEGLQRLRLLDQYPADVTEADLLEVMYEIDSGFDGRVSLPNLSKAIFAIKASLHEEMEETQQEQAQAKTAETYGERLPLHKVKVDKVPRSLFMFEQSFLKFRRQQSRLLVMNKERTEREHEMQLQYT